MNLTFDLSRFALATTAFILLMPFGIVFSKMIVVSIPSHEELTSVFGEEYTQDNNEISDGEPVLVGSSSSPVVILSNDPSSCLWFHQRKWVGFLGCALIIAIFCLILISLFLIAPST